ncbi:hypothetical protein [Deinococcus sp. LM3]|uniref:hypothetical protein n=1 Tax=Deinococcus sp. LM3 TaxID=1938608 RepID=UPI000991E1EF|nr:hypothetical protein [Deinococcus sp. LM3]OOV11353.1 hypothetical protein BXU09_20005 [Deinococcus sp. LM3]
MKLIILLLCLSGLASAQVPDLSSVNVAFLLNLASDPVGLGLLVFGLMATLKRNLARREPPLTWAPWRWWGLTVLVSTVCAGALHLLMGFPDVRGFVLFVLVTAVVAIAGRDGLKTALGWLGGLKPASPVTVEQAGTVEVNAAPAAPAAAPGEPVITVERPGTPIPEEIPR